MRERASSLPKEPGVYQFLDAEQNILYIGKAKDLRVRVKSYFSKDIDGKTRLMLQKAADIDYIVTHNEKEALLLENRLINQHKPPYNIMLRENRRYAWILVTAEKYPRILSVRDKRRKGRYYGPYTDGTARRKTVIALTKAFKIRTCRVLPKRVCLQYHIGNCTGPCEGRDTKEAYNERIQQAERVLKGDTRQLTEELRADMKKAAAQQHFERAAEIRDMLGAIESLDRGQVVERETGHDQDVIARVDGEEEAVFIVLHVRSGVIAKKREYRVPAQRDVQEEFLTALYRDRIPPREVLTHDLTGAQQTLLSAYLSEVTNSTVEVRVPERGEKRRLVALAEQNAELARDQEDQALTRLQEALRLPAVPETIDCFDVSTHQGAETVAAAIRYRNGRPDPSAYRHFNIQEAEHDDYASMREAVGRRYREGDLPDLVVIDGGKGQLGAAQEALSGRHVPIVALAKKEEEIFVPGLSFPIRLKEKDPGLLLLRRIRDATHRFVIGHHRSRRRKQMSASLLDHLEGVGRKRKELLYKKFKTFERIQQASEEELQDLLGEKTGSSVYEQLR